LRLSEVIERFSLISGLEGEELSRYVPLCVDAVSRIKCRACGAEKLGLGDVRRLENCAAALAFYKYALYSQEGTIESFEAGAVKVSLGKGLLERARMILDEELRGAQDIVSLEDDFAFKGVRV